jgi:hypothetical protein
MQLKKVEKVERAGVGFKGVKIIIDSDVTKMTVEFPYAAIAGPNRITLFPGAFSGMRLLLEL